MNYTLAANIGSKASFIVIAVVVIVSILSIFNVFPVLSGYLLFLVLLLPGVISYFYLQSKEHEAVLKQVCLNGAASGLFTSMLLLLIMLLIAFVSSFIGLSDRGDDMFAAMVVAIITAIVLIVLMIVTNGLSALLTCYIKNNITFLKKES